MSAKELTTLILDEERLRTERSDRKTWKSRVTGIEEYAPQGSNVPSGEPPRRRQERRAQRPDEDDIEYNLAIEASKHEAEEDKKRRESRASAPQDDDDLAKAIRLSKEEEELRRRELEESSNGDLLFDNTPAPSAQPQLTGYNQGYQQQGAVDWFGNPVDQQPQQPQQPQSTGYLNNAYSQQGLQNQATGFQNGFSQSQQQPQQTGFDQFQQSQPNYLQPQQTIQPQHTIQPQQTAFNNGSNPYGQQMGLNNGVNPYGQQSDFGSQFGQQPQVSSPSAGSHNPWGAIQQPPEALKPAPTGSNNPFASSFNRPQPQSQQSGPPTLSSLAEQRTATQFNNQSSFNPITSFSSPQQPPAPRKEENAHTARLNQLLATGEGMDTFGNTGESRIPSQHTAPGTFVNSAGHGLNHLHSSQTGGGNNPFFSQQFTGAPQQQSSATGFGAQQQPNRFVPAQTGPAGVNGFGGSPFGQASNNPFGAQQHQGQQGGGVSLIDL